MFGMQELWGRLPYPFVAISRMASGKARQVRQDSEKKTRNHFEWRHGKCHEEPPFSSNCSNKALPLPVSWYFWRRLVGLLGMVISTRLVSSNGLSTWSRNLVLLVRPTISMRSLIPLGFRHLRRMKTWSRLSAILVPSCKVTCGVEAEKSVTRMPYSASSKLG